jgi:hypothetical protein
VAAQVLPAREEHEEPDDRREGPHRASIGAVRAPA